jgi:SAM-dependent methyltransferase
MGAYYPDDYAPYQYTKARPPTKARRSLARAAGRLLINFNSDRLPPGLAGHALELGCASGSYMDYLSTLGLSVEGVELNTSAAEVARQRGYRVQNCVVEAMEPPEKPVSLVVAWMVLEHLHDPIGALARLGEWAAPNARLVASVPNFAPLAASLFGSEWYPLHLPCHLFHFTPETLGAVIGRAGWRLERVFYHRTLNDFVATGGNWAESAGHAKLADRLRTVAKKRNFHLAAYPLAAAASLFGQTGRMTIWAKREG